jgi:hypothetical protein
VNEHPPLDAYPGYFCQVIKFQQSAFGIQYFQQGLIKGWRTCDKSIILALASRQIIVGGVQVIAPLTLETSDLIRYVDGRFYKSAIVGILKCG